MIRQIRMSARMSGGDDQAQAQAARQANRTRTTDRQKALRRQPGLQRQPLETHAEVGWLSTGCEPARVRDRLQARPPAKRLVFGGARTCLQATAEWEHARERRESGNPFAVGLKPHDSPVSLVESRFGDGKGKEGQAP